MTKIDVERQSEHGEQFDTAQKDAERSGVAMRVWARHRLRELAASGRLGIGAVREQRRV
ncbi:MULTISPECIES: hypothetical protein [Rhodopseudomonas]|uniref:Uncharacterized protein n=1 Tax=Rhodopseudomonas palustris (strain DX-1) TaxID=652103 RepID=E6VC32_RHOPX|nr:MULTISPECIES: hypothetical protein [Rhodopseudomonas]